MKTRTTRLDLQSLESREVPALTFLGDSGNTAADVQDTVNQYRAILGGNNGVGGTFASGSREINWDGVPAAFAAPNSLPANFFNSNSPRGVVFSTPGTGFQVSGNTADAGTGQPAIEFANLNATYPTLFTPFSAQRLFTPVGSNVMDITFFIPGTSIPATTNAFGVIFSDVDNAGTTIMQFFDVNGNSLFGGAVSPTFPEIDGGFSFLGAFDNANAASIARVRITTGNTAVGADEAGSTDIVVMDDFIYGEPVAAPAAPTISNITNQTGSGGIGPIAFTVSDVNTPAGQLAISATSSNTSLVPNGNISFGGTGASRTVFVNPIAGVADTATITITVTDGDGQTASDTFDVTVAAPSTDLFAVSSGPGISSTVEVFNNDGTLRFILHPYGTFTGGATVGTGDLTGDGIDDIVTGAGPSGSPHVKVFDGTSGQEIASFFAYDGGLRSGVFVGLGDVTGDRRADIVTGAGFGGSPHVKVFDGASLTTVRSFFAFDSSFIGGVTVRAGDVDNDGFADIVTGAGPGAGPHVKVFSGADHSLLQSFFAADPTFTGGVFVGVANLRGDARFELIASVNGRVGVWGAASANNLLPYVEQDNFTPLGKGLATGTAAIRLASGNVGILVGAAPGAGSSRVQIVDGTSNTIRFDFSAFDPAFTGGIFVG